MDIPTNHCIGCASTWPEGYMQFVYVPVADCYVCHECATVNPEEWAETA